MANGKLEGRITVPTGGWDLALTETGGGGASGTVTVAAGKYYHSSAKDFATDFPAELAVQLDAIGNATYTVTVDATEGGTGKYTISATGGSVTAFAISWTDTDQRDMMGFSQGNLSGGLTYTSDDQAKLLWLPSKPPVTLALTDVWRGWHETDLHQLESPLGHVFSIAGERKTIMSMQFPLQAAAKTWRAQESTVNESFEQMYLDCIYGAGPGGTPGGPVRWHQDADTDGTYGTYYVVGMREWKPADVQEGWTGRYTISLPRLVQDPDEVT